MQLPLTTLPALSTPEVFLKTSLKAIHTRLVIVEACDPFLLFLERKKMGRAHICDGSSMHQTQSWQVFTLALPCAMITSS